MPNSLKTVVRFLGMIAGGAGAVAAVLGAAPVITPAVVALAIGAGAASGVSAISGWFTPAPGTPAPPVTPPSKP